MYVDELIEKLLIIRKEHGNIPVRIQDTDCYETSIEEICYDKCSNNNNINCVLIKATNYY